MIGFRTCVLAIDLFGCITSEGIQTDISSVGLLNVGAGRS
jgi:hypothetical protein